VSDINWAGLNNRRNPFSDFAEGLQGGADMRRQRERDNLFAQRQAFEIEEATRRRAQEDALAARKAEVGAAVATGDLGAARKAAGGDFDMLESIGKLDAQQRKIAQDNAEDIGGFAAGLSQAPYEQRKAIIAQARPILLQKGFTEQQIDAFDPSDANLQGLVTSSMDLKTALGEVARKADDKRADEQLAETKRSNTVREGISRGQLGVSQSNSARGWAAHRERVKSKGYGTPGSGVIADDDVEIDP
jgi:hypothetical protein